VAKPAVAIFDDFFEEHKRLREDIIGGDFIDYKSPWDGVVYPGINGDIPLWAINSIHRRLMEIMDLEIDIHTIFSRLTTRNTPSAPHKIHSDKIMGEYSLHIYLSKEWPSGSGTSFWNHATEGQRHTDQTNIANILRDQNDPTRKNWNRVLHAQGNFNRAIIHDATLWHCAEPVGGWGVDKEDGRVVLTTFFSEVRQ
jgi:hypothetical protein